METLTSDSEYLGEFCSTLNGLNLNFNMFFLYFAAIESTDINFFTSHLIGLVAQVKPENIPDFFLKYFLRVESCQHVIGSDYNFIIGCSYNRRAFIFCLAEVLANYSSSEEFTAAEFQQIVEQLCPDFVSSIVADSVKLLEPKSATRPPKYLLRELLVSFSFHLVYMEWLREVDRLYATEASEVSRAIPLSKLKSFFLGLQASWPVSLELPPEGAIEAVVSHSTSTPTQHNLELIKDEFKRAIVENQTVIAILFKIRTMGPVGWMVMEGGGLGSSTSGSGETAATSAGGKIATSEPISSDADEF